MLRPYDIVVVNQDVDDEDIRGLEGYVIGEVSSEQIGIFVYERERVWCLHPSCVRATGASDEAARRDRGAPLRVNSKGEIIG